MSYPHIHHYLQMPGNSIVTYHLLILAHLKSVLSVISPCMRIEYLLSTSATYSKNITYCVKIAEFGQRVQSAVMQSGYGMAWDGMVWMV